LNELYQLIEERLILKTEGLMKKSPIYRDFREGDVRHSQADISKATKLLGYVPTHVINEGLDVAMSWYVESLTKRVDI